MKLGQYLLFLKFSHLFSSKTLAISNNFSSLGIVTFSAIKGECTVMNMGMDP